MSESGRPSPVEHSVSEVGGSKGRELSSRDKILLAAAIAVIALGFIWINHVLREKAPLPEKTAATATGGGEQYTAPPPVQAKVTDADLPLPAASGTDTGAAQKANPATAPILTFSGGGSTLPIRQLLPIPGAGTAVDGAAVEPAPTPAQVPPSNNNAATLAAKLRPTVLTGATASVIKNPDMMVTEGTLIPCILQTAIDTQLAGFVTCVVPVDVRGTTGNVVLLDRGTKIVGQIQSGLVQGQERVFVLWTRAETPKHVVISLNAPGADELGRSGLPGAVDNHWWERFGGALMLTLVQGSLNAGTALAANNGNSGSSEAALGFVYGAQSSGQQVANTALENTINIPPTLRKNQGDTVTVFVAQDLDFGSVYGLKVSSAGHE